MRQGSLIHLAMALLAAVLPATAPARAQPVDPARVAAVKAGMVVNFVRYTTWPEGTFADETSPIVLTVVGQTDIDEALSAAVEGVLIDGRRIEIRRAAYPAPPEGEDAPTEADVKAFYQKLRTSQAIFFGGSETARFEAMLEEVNDADVLTVSDIEGFAEKGGMLGLAFRERRVAFDANEGEIEATKLEVSSQVLKLGRIVETAPKQAAEEAP